MEWLKSLLDNRCHLLGKQYWHFCFWLCFLIFPVAKKKEVLKKFCWYLKQSKHKCQQIEFYVQHWKKNNNLTLIFVLYFCCWNKQTFSSNVYLMISWLCVFSFDQIRKLNQFVSSISENSPNFSFYFFFVFVFGLMGNALLGEQKQY